MLAVDRDPLHLRIACANAEVYGVGEAVTGLVADVQTVDLTGIDAVFIDPARREGDRRLGSSLSEPPFDWCFGLAERVAAVGIKSAPGIDHDLVPAGWEIEFVADGRDLKESVLWSPAMATTPRRATLLPGDETLVSVPGDEVEIREPGAYLLDPNPAVTRAGWLRTWRGRSMPGRSTSRSPFFQPITRCRHLLPGHCESPRRCPGM